MKKENKLGLAKLAIILSILFILILGIIAFVYLKKVNREKKEEKFINLKLGQGLFLAKCISLCLNEEKIKQPGCHLYCINMNIQNNKKIKDEMQNVNFEFSKEDTDLINNHEISKLAPCTSFIYGTKNDSYTNYDGTLRLTKQECDEIFEKYKSILDVRDFKLGNYKTFNLDIINSSCMNDTAIIKMKWASDSIEMISLSENIIQKNGQFETNEISALATNQIKERELKEANKISKLSYTVRVRSEFGEPFAWTLNPIYLNCTL